MLLVADVADGLREREHAVRGEASFQPLRKLVPCVPPADVDAPPPPGSVSVNRSRGQQSDQHVGKPSSDFLRIPSYRRRDGEVATRSRGQICSGNLGIGIDRHLVGRPTVSRADRRSSSSRRKRSAEREWVLLQHPAMSRPGASDDVDHHAQLKPSTGRRRDHGIVVVRGYVVEPLPRSRAGPRARFFSSAHSMLVRNLVRNSLLMGPTGEPLRLAPPSRAGRTCLLARLLPGRTGPSLASFTSIPASPSRFRCSSRSSGSTM
jgi:hypothetical protein